MSCQSFSSRCPPTIWLGRRFSQSRARSTPGRSFQLHAPRRVRSQRFSNRGQLVRGGSLAIRAAGLLSRVPSRFRLAESDLPVHRMFAPRPGGPEIARGGLSRKRRLGPFWDGHPDAAASLTQTGRSFVRALVDLEGGKLASCQVIRFSRWHPTLRSLTRDVGATGQRTFVLVGPGDHTGLLLWDTGAVTLRAGDLWMARGGLSKVGIDDPVHQTELLLLQLSA